MTNGVMAQTTSAAARSTPRLWKRDFILASFAFIVVMIGTTLPTSLYPLYRLQFALSEMMITVIYGVYAVGTITALIIAGSWSDLLGRRIIMFAAVAFSAASGIMFLFDLLHRPLYCDLNSRHWRRHCSPAAGPARRRYGLCNRSRGTLGTRVACIGVSQAATPVTPTGATRFVALNRVFDD